VGKRDIQGNINIALIVEQDGYSYRGEKMNEEKNINEVMDEIHVKFEAFVLPDVSKCTTRYIVFPIKDDIKNYWFLLNDGSFFYIQYRFFSNDENNRWTLYNYKFFDKKFIKEIAEAYKCIGK